MLRQFRSVLELQAQRSHVVMAIYETLALVHAQAVDDAGVCLGIIDHHVARDRKSFFTAIFFVDKNCSMLLVPLQFPRNKKTQSRN